MVKVWLLGRLFKDIYRYLQNEDEYIKAMAIGMNSYIDREADEHFLFLDYDIKDEFKIESSVQELQRQFNLSHAFIYETSKGYHVFFFYDNDLPYSRIRLLISYAKFVDPLFKLISKYYNHKTIRVAGKYKIQDIRFKKTIKGRNPTREEFSIGEIKRREYNMLKSFHDILKNNQNDQLHKEEKTN